MKRLLIFMVMAIGLIACEDESFTPKPPTYLRLDLPDHSYSLYTDSCDYSFEKADIFTVNNAPNDSTGSCHRRVDMGPLNATILLRYWHMDKPLSFYVNKANDEIDRHKFKAQNITDKRIIRGEDNIYGVMFELQGDVATPYQFYLTDSTNRFAYGEVLLGTRPNYDSLKPALDYMKVDLEKMIHTFKWDNH